MIKAIALDDEPPALEVLASFCAQTGFIELEKTFTRPDEAARYLSAFPVDLLFLDINMPSVSGLDFKRSIDPNTLVIFTTAYSDYALEGFNLNAVDYLLKPFTPERFRQAADKARSWLSLRLQSPEVHPGFISIRVDYALVKVPLADILFIEGLDDYLKIHLEGRRPLLSRMTMKAMIEKLPAAGFIRVHRSYIVPLARVASVRNKSLLIGDTEIPIGASYEARFFEVFGR
ncbi:LytR/AlgR family response regulator transcription factor [Flaviaesturariibacter terrae]